MIKKLNDKLNKIGDAFCATFKLDKATAFAYFFFLLTLFILINRGYSTIYMLFTGISANYIHPLVYALEICCPALAFMYACSSSKFGNSVQNKVKLCVQAAFCTYGIVMAMAFQWINKLIWLILAKLPNFAYVIHNMPETIQPAIIAATFVGPIFTIPFMINWYINDIKDDAKYIEGIEDYTGKIATKAFIETGPYTCEVLLCRDLKSDKQIKTPEKRRYESTLIQGSTGTGKTATMIEPMCAYDIEKKFFFREMAKSLGYEALREGLATINIPISNEYLNENFSLTYLTPKPNRREEYMELVKKLVLYDDVENSKIYYKDIGLTLVAPDSECISRVRKVAAAYHIKVNYIDPLDETSLGMNPFVLEDPAQVAVIISTVLKGMYEADNGGESNIFFAQVTQQALENLTILLKVMHPRMNNGEIPTLEDMLKMLYDFNLVELTCEEMKKDPVLYDEYKVLIGYFERNFYKPPVNINGFEIPGIVGSGRKDTERFIYGAITQLDNLLRHPGVKNIICNRDNNIAFDKVLEDGGIITICSQKGTLANILSKAFGMFFILAFQYAVLRRPGFEKTRIPHFLYIDEFPDYINKETETCFTQFRKYRCGMTIAIQNLSQLERTQSMKFYREVVLTNTKTQVVFGDTNYEDSEYWSNSMGVKEKWIPGGGVTWSPGEDNRGQKVSGIKKDDKPQFKKHKIQGLGFKQCIYRTKDATGKSKVGKGKTDFVAKKHYEDHIPKTYNFVRYIPNSVQYTDTSTASFFSGDNGNSFIDNYIDNNDEIKTAEILNTQTKTNTDETINNINEKINSIVKEENNNNFNIVLDDNIIEKEEINKNNSSFKENEISFDDLFNNDSSIIDFNNPDDKK